MTVRSMLDPAFRYVPSASADLRKTFAPVRREMWAFAAPVAAKIGDAPPRGVGLAVVKSFAHQR
jgi:hypothetical protein